MPIKRETLNVLKANVRHKDFGEGEQVIYTLIDACLQLLDTVEGGPDIQAQRAALADRDRQVRLALKDIQDTLAKAWPPGTFSGPPQTVTAVLKAKFTVDLAIEMVKAKGPAWTRAWDWYTPRIEEEFSR